MAYNASGLTNYVEVKKDVLIKDIVLGGVKGDTIENLRKQLGVKTSERLNYLDVAPSIQNGRGCGFSAQGATNFSERLIETAAMKVNDEWCPDDLLGKFAEYLVKYGANANAEDGMPFEKEVLDEVVAGINEQMEKLVWQGATSAYSGTDLINGFLTIAENADSASTIAVSVPSGATKIAAIKQTILAIPEDIIDEAVVFVSPAFYRGLVFELVEQNLYHFDPTAGVEDKDIVFPGTSIRIHKTIGLKGASKIYASAYENMVYGTDLMNDKEEIRVWFSDDEDKYRIKAKWNAGVNTLYPDMVVVATLN